MSYFEVFVRRLVSSMCVIALCCSASSLTFAQASSASLGITVSDASGAVIQGAMATLRNSDTNQQQTAVSNKTGNANFPFLKPGHYALTVSREGFSDVTVTGILLNVGDGKHIQLVLKVGTTSQDITVDGSGTTINTTNGSVSTVIDRQFVANIPLNGRSFQDLISMTPGILTQNPQNSTTGTMGYSGDFSVNGQRTESNYYTVDGVTGNVGAGNGYGVPQAATAGGVAASTALGTTQSLLSVDALQEFRVASSTYSAEFGRSPGGQFAFVTRSGTNHIHGTLYDFFRNDIFDANDWFSDQNRVAKAALRQNDFGGTLGGPIRIPKFYDGKDRSFFFVSYEGLRLTQPQPGTTQYVPYTAMREEAPQALQPILNAYPIQTGTDYGTTTSPSLAVFAKSYSLPSTINSTSVRLDHTISPQLALFFRASYTPTSTESRVLAALSAQDVNTQMYTLGATSQFNSRLSNEFRIGYAGSSSARAASLDSFGGAQPVDLQMAMTGSDSAAYFSGGPEIYVPGIGISEQTVGKTKNSGQQWNIVDSISWLKGKHQLKAGIDYLHIRSELSPQSLQVGAIWESAAQVLNNQAIEIPMTKALSSIPVFDYAAAFLQDEWRIDSRLSLSAGLRWEVDPAPTEAHGQDAYTVLGNPADPASLSLAPQGTSLWKTTFSNFAPRLGIAWQAHNAPGRETILRAGGGVFFDSDNWAATQGYIDNAIGFSATNILYSAPLPVTPTQLDFQISTTPPFTQASAYAFPSHLQLPYTFEWNASLEQALGEHQSFTLSYVGANGRRLLGEQRFTFTTSENPTFQDGVYLFDANLTSSYNSLQVKYQRSIAHGLQALTSYAWSHSIDFGSSAVTLPTIRGNSDFDVRHNFSGGATWDLPTTARIGVADALLNGWGLDGRLILRTGFPLTLGGNLLTDSTGERYYGGVNFVPGQPYYSYAASYPGGKALNHQAFVANTSPTANGTVPRNYFRGFGETQLNLSMRRNFRLTDSTSLQFRADSFNIPNHPNFGTVDTTLSAALFGQATNTLAESLATVASQYQQGGPRSFQFSLKLTF